MHIHLLPTHSLLNTTYRLPNQPAEMVLHQHQVATYEALYNHAAEVIIHTGMTGDGKSLAGELLALTDPNHHILGMYPTNELIRDQDRHLQQTSVKWGKPIIPEQINAATLDEWSAEEETSRGTALLAMLRNSQVALTNPDIFHYMVMGLYYLGNHQPLYLLEKLLLNFRQYTFDEFHLYDQPQATAVLSALIALKHLAGPRIPSILLQSATPEPELLAALIQGGLSVHEIKGNYAHSETPPDGYRTILQAVDLEIVSGESVGDWLLNKGEAYLLPILRRGQQRVAALFNSLFEAMAVYTELSERLPGYRVAHNTGITPPSARQTSLWADVVLGTSTVDIGVDLNINTLIFEAYDGASFKQRLGRLGRHASYKSAEGDQGGFDCYQAVACVPPWIYARLQEHCTAEMTREAFFGAVDEAYGQRNRIWAYNRQWGWIPTYDLLYRLGHPVIREQYQAVSGHIARDEMAMLGLPQSQVHHYAQQFKEIRKTQPQLLDAAKAFRDSTPFVAVMVNNAYQGVEKYQFYDFARLLVATQFDLDDLNEIKQQALKDGLPLKTWERQAPVAAFRADWSRSVPDPKRQITISLERETWRAIENDASHQIVVSEGVNLSVVPSLPIGDALRRIRRRQYVMRIVLGHTSHTLKARLALPTYFSLFPFETYDSSAQGVVAFGRDALLLDAAALRLRDVNTGALVF